MSEKKGKTKDKEKCEQLSPEEKVLNYYAICHRLKDVVRTGWMRWGVRRERLESVAEHVFGTQMLALAMKSEFHYDIDIEKVILMLAVHEIGEAVTGDFIQFEIDHKEKERLEHLAVAEVLKPLVDGEKINAIFEEFDAHKTPEAKFAYQCDKLECDIQCKIYDEERCVDLKKQNGNKILQDPLVKKLSGECESWSEMWLKFSQNKIDFDEHFRAVSDYLMQEKDCKFLLAKYNLDEDLVKHMTRDVFPEYAENDGGHQMGHIWYVIRRGLKFAEKVEGVDYNKVFVVAGYHDVKKHVDRSLHEKLSAEALREDKKLKDFFSEEEIVMMSEAVEDHRASKVGEPRNIYGKIVSSADRSTDLNAAIKRTLKYLLEQKPEATMDEMVDYTFEHIGNKFGKGGYAREKCYFEDVEYEAFLQDAENATRTRAEFKKRVERALEEMRGK